MLLDLRPTGLKGRASAVGLRRGRHHRERQHHPLRRGSPVQPQRHPPRQPRGDLTGDAGGGDGRDRRPRRHHAGRLRRPRGARQRVREREPGAVPALPARLPYRAVSRPRPVMRRPQQRPLVPGAPALPARLAGDLRGGAAEHVAGAAGGRGGPSRCRAPHPRPAHPRLGGIAMFAGFAVALAVFGSGVDERWDVVAVTAAITVAMAVDDVLRLPAWSKLVIEMGAGIMVALLGITITFFGFHSHPGGILDLGLLAAAGDGGLAGGHAGVDQPPRWRRRRRRRGGGDRRRGAAARRHQSPGGVGERCPGRRHRHERRADGVLLRIPRLEHYPGPGLHGRLRQPLPRRRAWARSPCSGRPRWPSR